MELSPQSRMKRITISIFIVFTAIAIVLTNNSEFAGDSRLIQPVMTVLNAYARWSRLMQRWALFCPEPRRYVIRYYFDVHFRDGTVKQWHRPYPPKWGFFARYHASTWQKFDTASNHMENPALWPDIAKWVARKFANSTNPPVEVQLFAEIAQTPAPKNSGRESLLPTRSKFRFRKQQVFTYSVTDGRVQ